MTNKERCAIISPELLSSGCDVERTGFEPRSYMVWEDKIMKKRIYMITILLTAGLFAGCGKEGTKQNDLSIESTACLLYTSDAADER